MKKSMKFYLGSTAFLSAVALTSPAFAQVAVLTPGTPATELVSATTKTEFDPATEVTTTTTTFEVSVEEEYSQTQERTTVGSVYGQAIGVSSQFDAVVSYNQTTDVVVTATPDGAFGFDISAPVVGATTQSSPSTITEFSGIQNVSTDITGMYSATSTISNAAGGDADLVTSLGSVTTSATVYQDYTRKATFDPITGEVTAGDVDPDSLQSTVLSAQGLSTTGSVSANSVYGQTVSAQTVSANAVSAGTVTATNVQAGSVTVDGQVSASSVNAGYITAESVYADYVAAQIVAAEQVFTYDVGLVSQDGETITSLVETLADLRETDVTLQSNIDAEATTRAAADVALGARITTEETARKAEDAKLAAADVVLQTNINAEATTRAAADVALGARITTEETARIAADTGLGNRITTESNARIAADLAESNARIAADNALGARITDETNQRIAADSVLRDMIASSTATAIALGGNAILPDANFTLAGNVGFYQGATAISLNAAGRVADKVYLTAAVGGGTNKRGEVGGRVGVVFGF